MCAIFAHILLLQSVLASYNRFLRIMKHKHHSNQAPSSDGFVPMGGDIDSRPADDIRHRFRSHYRPEEKSMSGVSYSSSLDDTTLKNSSEGFQSASPSLDTSQNNQEFSRFDLSEKPKSRRRFSPFRRHRKSRGKVRRAVGIASIALVLAVGSLIGYGYIKARNIFKGNGDGAAALNADVQPAQLNGEGDGRVNILMLGKGGPGETAPDLTDTILLASIDPIANEAALLSVPRDLYVQDPNGASTKINAVYANAKSSAAYQGEESEEAIENAGLRAIKQTVSDVLGVPIHYYVMVNFDAFERAIDSVGGITVDVEEPLYDQTVAWLLGGNPLVADQGLQTFDGERALLYARSRKGSARGDFDRTERQREIIVALQQKVLSLGTFSNPLRVIELLDALGDNVRTDLNGLGEVKRLYEIGQQIGPDKVTSIGLADPPNILVATDFIANQSVVVPVAGLYQYDDIRSYVRNTIRDPFLKRENARVIVLNGTTIPGVAAATEEELKSYGYNVVGVGNAPDQGTYPNTLLLKVSDAETPFTESYIKKRLNLEITALNKEGIPTSETADFVIIVGEDEAQQTVIN